MDLYVQANSLLLLHDPLPCCVPSHDPDSASRHSRFARFAVSLFYFNAKSTATPLVA